MLVLLLVNPWLSLEQSSGLASNGVPKVNLSLPGAELEVWVGFLKCKASQHRHPTLSVPLASCMLPTPTPTLSPTGFFSLCCRSWGGAEMLQLEAVTAGTIPVEQMLAACIHYYYLLSPLQ